MHQWFCPVHLIHPIEWKCLHFDETRMAPKNVVYWIKSKVNISGGSRIYGANLRGWSWGANIWFGQNFPKTAWNLKNLDPHGGGARPKFYHVDPPLNMYYVKTLSCNRSCLFPHAVCAPGYYFDASCPDDCSNIGDNCTACPIGSYKSGYSNDDETSCTLCDGNKTTLATGSKDESACGQYIILLIHIRHSFQLNRIAPS